MTSVHYNLCDSCGATDDYSERMFHYSVQDVNGMNVGHLCENCVRKHLHLSVVLKELAAKT